MRTILAFILCLSSLMAQAQQIKLDHLTPEQKAYLMSFYGFGKEFLKLPIYDGQRVRPDFNVCDRNGVVLYRVNGAPTWQKEVMDAVDGHNSKTTAITANGAGKTNVVIPTLALAHMTFYPNSRVVITSGGNRQVKDQIFPALKAHEGKFRDWKFQDLRITAPNGAVCIGFSTDEGGKFEGWHGNTDELYALSADKKKELETQFQKELAELNDLISSGNQKGPLMIIVDEAKSIRKEIFDAILRCTAQRVVFLSSGGEASGEFYESHQPRSTYTKLRAPAAQCPHADHARNIELIEKRGVSDPLVQSKVFADFMRSQGDTVIARADVDALVNNAPDHKAGDRKFMCDFAAGGAENVFGARNGNRITLPAKWRESDTMKACSQFILHFRQAGLSPDDAYLIHADNSGLGKPIIDRLAELGWQVTRVENGGKPADSAYVNLSAEAWWEAGKDIQKRLWLLPEDDVLVQQLSTRKPVFKGDKLGVMSKEDMKKEGLESPDRADVVVELMRPVRAMRPQSYLKEQSPIEQYHEERTMPQYSGFDAGG